MLYIRELEADDEEQFLSVMRKSKEFYAPFVTPITEKEAFQQYYNESKTESLKSYLALDLKDTIVGVFTISEIARGCFQSGYLGYGANVEFANRGLMSTALNHVLQKIFEELKVHRVEANVQPTNTASIQFIKKNGFVKEGFSPRYLKVNNQWCDHFRFALTYEDWINFNLS